MENMLFTNSSATSTYCLYFTLFPTVVFYRKVVDWLFSLLVLYELVVNVHRSFKTGLLPSQASPWRNQVSSALMKPVKLCILSTLLNKASPEGHPAKVDKHLNSKRPGFIQKDEVRKKNNKKKCFSNYLKKQTNTTLQNLVNPENCIES